MELILPTFIIFGAMRCGSTALYNYLDQHPDVHMSQQRKELNFFNMMPHNGTKIEDYAAYFTDWQGQKAIGEGSVNYIYHHYVPELLAEHLPHVKLVCILRNPAKRAFSNYLWTFNRGREWLEFEAALAQEDQRIGDIAARGPIAYYSYKDRGRYANQIRRYLQHFDRDAIHCVVFENLINSPQDELKKLCRFLEIDDDFEFQTIKKGEKEANANKYPLYPGLMRRLAYMRHASKNKPGVQRLEKIAKQMQAQIPMTGTPPKLQDEVYEQLMHEFEPDIRDLHQLMGWDVLQWLDPQRIHEKPAVSS